MFVGEKRKQKLTTHILKMFENSLGTPFTSQGMFSLQILKIRNLENSFYPKQEHKNG